MNSYLKLSVALGRNKRSREEEEEEEDRPPPPPLCLYIADYPLSRLVNSM